MAQLRAASKHRRSLPRLGEPAPFFRDRVEICTVRSGMGLELRTSSVVLGSSRGSMPITSLPSIFADRVVVPVIMFALKVGMSKPSQESKVPSGNKI